MKIRRNLIQCARISALLLGFTGLLSAQTSSSVSVSNSFIIQVAPGVDINQVSNQMGFTVDRILGATPQGTTYAVTTSGVTNQPLTPSAVAGVNWVTDNSMLTVAPLDGGETVLPLDGGETVLPLDGGSTLIPLGPGIDSVNTTTIQGALKPMLRTLDGGETVLPLDGGESVLPLEDIQTAYKKVAALTTGSPGLILQRAFGRIGYFGAVQQATGKGVTIAVIDTGADTCHPALSSVLTYNFVSKEPVTPETCPVATATPGPGYGHGTEVASLLRILAPEANIWLLRAFDSTGTADVATVYQATIWAVDHGAQIINMSFGSPINSPALSDAVSYAKSHNVLVAAAAGNSNQEALAFPAGLKPVLATVATDLMDAKAPFSNYSYSAGVSAPGTDVVAAYPGGRFAIVWGTSFAAPMVAAEAALISSAWASTNSMPISFWSLRNAIVNNADNIDALNPDLMYKLGSGRINMWRAVHSYLPPTQ